VVFYFGPAPGRVAGTSGFRCKVFVAPLQRQRAPVASSLSGEPVAAGVTVRAGWQPLVSEIKSASCRDRLMTLDERPVPEFDGLTSGHT
jgi:hypothetical protein